MCNLAVMSKDMISRAHNKMSEDDNVLIDFEKNLCESQTDLPPEFQKVLSDNYWDLLS